MARRLRQISSWGNPWPPMSGSALNRQNPASAQPAFEVIDHLLQEQKRRNFDSKQKQPSRLTLRLPLSGMRQRIQVLDLNFGNNYADRICVQPDNIFVFLARFTTGSSSRRDEMFIERARPKGFPSLQLERNGRRLAYNSGTIALRWS